MHLLTSTDYFALLSLILCWTGYIAFCRRLTRKGLGLVAIVSNLRLHWMKSYVNSAAESPRIAEAQVLNMLQNSVSFYITITIFVLAGLMAMFTSLDTVIVVLDQLPYQIENATITLPIKLLLLIVIFIIAFFRFSWALRQGRYYVIALFALPQKELSIHNQKIIAEKLAKSLSIAAQSYNNAYHAYYFGLSALSWIVHPLLFITTNIWVVLVIYRREFKSRTSHVLFEINTLYDSLDDDTPNDKTLTNTDEQNRS